MTDPRIDQKFEVENKLYEDNKTPEEPRDWYPSSQAQELVRKFHVAFRAPVGNSPRSIGAERGFLRKDMLQEELNEFADAVDADDIVEQYDALIDILVLAYGGLVEMGIDAGPGKREVMRANMSKLDENGQPIISRGMELDGYPEGKILKGPNYVPPNLFDVLTKQGWKPTYEEYLKYNNLKDPREVLQALAGRPEIYEEVVKFLPDEDPDTDTLVRVKMGFSYNGVNYFEDEPHTFTKRIYQRYCICGKPELDDMHVPYEEPTPGRRKDNFQDKVLNGWKPDVETQIRYENHRQFLEYQFPSTRLVNGQLVNVIYTNGEKDVDWDFVNNEPR